MAKVNRRQFQLQSHHRTHFFHTVLIFLFLLQSSLLARDSILVLRYPGEAFEEAVRGITDDVGDEFTVIDEVLARDISLAEFSRRLSQFRPLVVVLMDNPAINLYRDYVSQLPDSSEVIPSVSLMSVYLEEVIKDLRKATGIRYEIPAVTSGVNLRSITKTPINKIGVLYRELMASFFEENREYCRQEKIQLTGIQLSNDPKNKLREVRDALKTLIEKEKVDAIWVLNDNVLLDVKILKKVWIPMTMKYQMPMIVGVEVLVDSRLNFGTFAVLPDHYAMGIQAAGMIYEVLDSQGFLNRIPIEQPLSVYKILNLKQAKQILVTDPKRLHQIDRILK